VPTGADLSSSDIPRQNHPPGRREHGYSLFVNEAVLISRSCTLGWFSDVLYGELWLHPVGLVRQRLGLTHTAAVTGNAYYQMMASGNVFGAVDTSTPPTIDANVFDLHQIAWASPKNRVLDFNYVTTARLHNGLMFDRLSVHMYDGSRHKFLWVRADNAYWLLRQELARRLGARFMFD
jgi:hypothetical protein